MIRKVIKLLAFCVIIGLIVASVYPPVMPDLMKKQGMKAANVTAKEMTPVANKAFQEKANDILDFLDEYGTVGWSKKEIDRYFREDLKMDEETGELVTYSDEGFETEIGTIEWSKRTFMDSCAEELVVDSDMVSKKEYYDKFDCVIEGNAINLYCKKHGELSAVSPYKVYEMEWCKEAEKLFPGIGDWLKSMEKEAVTMKTEDGQEVPVFIEDHYEGTRSKDFNGFTLNLELQELGIRMNQVQMVYYEGLTDLCNELEEAGWELDKYYADGMEKGLSCEVGHSDYAPLANVIVTDGKISRIDLAYNDYTKVDTDKVDEYQAALHALFKKAGIDDSVKDVLNDKGKKENYKVYTKSGETAVDYNQGESIEYDTYMVSIYDIQ